MSSHIAGPKVLRLFFQLISSIALAIWISTAWAQQSNQSKVLTPSVHGEVYIVLLAPKGDTNFSSNLKQILTVLEKKWNEEVSTSTLFAEKRSVAVQFSVQKDGSLLTNSERVVHGSGDKRLDNIAVETIRAVAPFDRLPDSYFGSRAEIRASFSYVP